MTQNPLEKLYRTKKVYISLPSQGKFYDDGINFSVDKEIGVMPMTSSDEIKLKSPDALFNGEGLFQLFKSCVPDIVNPREIPACDVNMLLIAIRIATTGIDIELHSQCPCGKSEDSYTVDLSNVMGSSKPIPEDNAVTVNGATLHVRPSTLGSQVLAQTEAFYQFRMQQMLNEGGVEDEEKANQVEETAKQFEEALVKTIALKTRQVAECIVDVIMDDETVVDNEDHIFQWIENMDVETYNVIQEKIDAMNDPGMNTTIKVKCSREECGMEYDTNLDLNPVNFFWPQP